MYSVDMNMKIKTNKGVNIKKRDPANKFSPEGLNMRSKHKIVCTTNKPRMIKGNTPIDEQEEMFKIQLPAALFFTFCRAFFFITTVL